MTSNERESIQRLLRGELSVAPVSTIDEHLLIAQKKAAGLLDVSRATIWRMTKEHVLRPVEILPGTWRYRYRDVLALAAPRNELSAPADASRRVAV